MIKKLGSSSNNCQYCRLR